MMQTDLIRNRVGDSRRRLLNRKKGGGFRMLVAYKNEIILLMIGQSTDTPYSRNFLG